jgi:SpoIID/LytB domain protein
MLVALLACATAQPPPAAAAPPAPVKAVADAGAADAGERATAAPTPSDAAEALFAHQVRFSSGVPTVTVRLMEGQTEVQFTPRGPLSLKVSGPVQKTLGAPVGTALTVRASKGTAATLGYAVQVADFPYADKDVLAQARGVWEGRGFAPRVLVEGAVYGIAGHVLDNRRSVLLLGPHTAQEPAKALQDQVAQQFGEATLLHVQLDARPHAALEVLDASGTVLATGEDLIVAEVENNAGFAVKLVEHDTGYAAHGREDRRYRGALLLTADAQGLLAVINLVPLEELLRGLVPSEIFAKAHPEALKAQAVTARGEVLAKVGVRHLNDPYLFCSDQHCQAYKGEGSETATTDAAIKATEGQVLFEKSGGPLVDTVYSAICGGHTEANENVWAGTPQRPLRGVPDVIGPAPAETDPAGGLTEAGLPAFLGSKATFACRVASMASPARFRWTRHFTGAEVDALLATYKVGHVAGLKVTERGVSGRAVALSISGETGAGLIRGELNIRRAFKNLPSAMFVLSSDASGWTMTGGGWGHGVGMCQIGAIGRAEHGETYKQILAHYFQDSELVQVYGGSGAGPPAGLGSSGSK